MRVADTAEIGVFGGSGFYSLLDDVREIKVDTPYGPPSDSLFLAEVAGRRVAFLPRHGRRHTIPPHKINYRANVWAMRSLGVKAAISPCAAGSLQLAVKPGDFVVCDQFVDRTSRPRRHVLRRPDRHAPLVGRDVRPGPAPARHRDDPRPRHRGPRAGHGRRHPGPALLDQGRVEVVQRRRLGGHQHDPVSRRRGCAASSASPSSTSASSPTTTPASTRAPRRSTRRRVLEVFTRERRADPEGRARPDRPVPGGPRRARAPATALEPTRGDGHTIAAEDMRLFETGSERRGVAGDRGGPDCRSGSACGRSAPSRSGGSRAPGASTRPATPGCGAGTISWARGDQTVPVVEAWTIAAMAAAQTTRVTVGPFVMNVMNRHPALVARMASTLQIASGGRLVLGIGIGGAPKEHEAYGIDFPAGPERVARLEEAVAVIRALWTGGPVTRPSPFYPLDDAYAFPVPDPAAADHHRWRDGGGRATGRPDRRRLDRVRRQLRGQPAPCTSSRSRRAVGGAKTRRSSSGSRATGWPTARSATRRGSREPRATWERWRAAGADGAIVLARSTDDVDALVGAVERW